MPELHASTIDIVLLAYDGMQILDITGPAAVFAAANDACGWPHYRIHILSADGGTVHSNSAVSLVSTALRDLAPESVHTLLVVGGDETGLYQLAALPAVRDWLLACAASAQRYGSICNGALLLGALGLLDDKNVTTHWDSCASLTRQNQRARVDPNALYIADGRLWTSAGVTTGIDMCLAIVEQDLGSAVTHTIAARLVLHARRPGYQTQFSPVLHAQARASDQFSGLIVWIKDNLALNLDINMLAARVTMSPRSFHRKFVNDIGDTPARFVETLRLDHAKQLLAVNLSFKEIAAQTGFANAAQFSKVFERRFGVTVGQFRDRHGSF